MSSLIDSEFATLVYWVRERERIRRVRALGAPKPWTNDPLLRDNRWCNVRRMDDKVSQFLFTDFYDPHAGRITALAQTTLARLINYIPSLHLIQADGGRMRKSDPAPPCFNLGMIETFVPMLEKLAAMNVTVFTAAYIIPGHPGMRKLQSVQQTVKSAMRCHDRIFDDHSAETSWFNLQKINYLGPFLAGQIIADICHMECGLRWRDAATWAPTGPGSLRGLSRLYEGAAATPSLPYSVFKERIYHVSTLLRAELPEVWEDRDPWMMDVQNCLCEFDKYRRLQLGTGSVRSSYPGASDSTRRSLL